MQVQKPKLVMIVPRFPYPLEKGDKLRAFNQIKHLSTDFEITLIYVTDKKISTESLQMLHPYCGSIHEIRINWFSKLTQIVACFINQKPLQVGYFYSYFGHLKVKRILDMIQPNHIYCQLIRSSEYAKDYHHCNKTLDYMDALSAGMEKRIKYAPFYSRKLYTSEAFRLKNYERKIFDYFENKTIISEQDKDYISHPQKKEIVVIANGIDERFFETVAKTELYDLVFVGNLSYAPNIEAVKFISKELANTQTGWTCLISGANPSLAVRKLVSKNNNLKLQDWVDDIRESYCKGKIFIAPMLIGTGMQNKILEALALGIPCITTSLANNAINATENESILVANDAEAFRQAIEKLQKDKDFYDYLSSNGKKYLMTNFSWSKTTNQLKMLLMRNPS